MMNKVSAEITAQQLEEFKQDILKLKAKYPWLISLTPEERNSSLRIGDKSFTLVAKTIEYADAHPEYLPPYVNVTEFKKDFKIWGDLNTMLRSTSLLTDSLSDTAIEAGNEAMEAAIAFYSSVREAAKRNAPDAQTIYDDLKARFQGRPTASKAAANKQ